MLIAKKFVLNVDIYQFKCSESFAHDFNLKLMRIVELLFINFGIFFVSRLQIIQFQVLF